MINTVKTEDGAYLLNNVIAHLEGLKVSYKPQDGGDRKGGFTLAEWKERRDNYKAIAEEAESRVKEIQEEAKKYVNLVATEKNDYDKAKKRRENIEKVLNAVKADAVGKQILESIIKRSKDYLVLYEGKSFYQTDLSYEGKNVLSAQQLHDIGLKTWEQIKLMDETKLFNIINNNNYFTANNRTRAKDAYDRLKKRKWGYLTNELYSMNGVKMTRAVMWNDKELEGKEFEEENELVFYEPNSYVNKHEEKISDRISDDKKKWPYAKPELRDIAIFMEEVFPRDKLNTNPIINSNDDGLRGKEMVEISWFGFEKKPDDNEFVKSTTYHKLPGKKGVVKVQAPIGNPAGFFKIFWDAFKDSTLLGEEVMSVKDFDSSSSTTTYQTKNINRTKLDERVCNNLYTDNWREVLAYADRIKWVIENLREDNTTAGTSPKLNIKFDDEWRAAAIEVGDTANIIENFETEKAKALSENKRLTEEELNIGFARADKFSNSFSFLDGQVVDYYDVHGGSDDADTYDLDFYDRFLSKAVAEEKMAKLASKGDEANYADIQNRLRRAQIEAKDARKNQKEAQDYIDRFAGMDLEGLKEAFKVIYKTGPSSSNKYFPGEIATMFSLLNDIQNKEPTKKLDNTFKGYETKLTSLQGEISKFTVITQAWTGLGGGN